MLEVNSVADKTEDRFTRVVFSVAASLIVSGVVGLWLLSTQVSRIEERVKALDDRVGVWTKTNSERVDYATARIDQITKEQRDSDRRLGAIEVRIQR